ncbi:hypothetical protein EYF80_018266 [Liparis tanakae]|uniref:Uncharacterized protein n=1 Tax=Liparis tanakae TaxID=230148 RepID=A0A4Z2I196_9TELE|nr:hypothetical protein EYF80_018266 [Liparis tanakae]
MPYSHRIDFFEAALLYLVFLYAGWRGGPVGNPSIVLQRHDEDLHRLLHELLPVVGEEQKNVTQGLRTALSVEEGRYMASEKQVSNNLSSSVLKRISGKDQYDVCLTGTHRASPVAVHSEVGAEEEVSDGQEQRLGQGSSSFVIIQLICLERMDRNV